MTALHVVASEGHPIGEPQTELKQGYAFALPSGLVPVFEGERRAKAIKLIGTSLEEGDFLAVDKLLQKDPTLAFSDTETRTSVLIHCLRAGYLNAAVIAAQHGLDLNQHPWNQIAAHTPLEAVMYSTPKNLQGIGLLLSLGADIKLVRPELTLAYLVDAVSDSDDKHVMLALRNGVTQASLDAADETHGQHVMTRVLSCLCRKDAWNRFNGEFDGKRRRDRVIAGLIKAGALPSGSGDHANAQPLANALGTKNEEGIVALLHLGAKHQGDILEEMAQMGLHGAIPAVKEALVVSTVKNVAAKRASAATTEGDEAKNELPKAAGARAKRYDL
ncbi:MAG: hypothetical protein O9327_04955 [Polaromonas sp.]|nr:hypothetical protein [Polaromonas sp.]